MPCDDRRNGDAVSAIVEKVEVGDRRDYRKGDDDQSEHVDEDDDSLLRGLELVLANEPDGHGEDDQLSHTVQHCDHGPTSRLGEDQQFARPL